VISTPIGPHTHNWKELHRDENDDRIRIKQICICGMHRFGCYAKRCEKDVDPDGFEEITYPWGPLYEWVYHR